LAEGEDVQTIGEAERITSLSGDVLQVQVYRPDGSLYSAFDLTDSIEVITIPNAEIRNLGVQNDNNECSEPEILQ